ncbi:GAF domain-containing protein [Fusibacter ferrireducens]|uniref:GAF domain-containing protein n=1 Tax=Fusibacter ferrireducens TaxID=2785058 RepID=A0ABR9ZS03_9FIRM|nr:GAF domain-containing protein [Fusibacter ferrireducens]MBF4692898.1 GAF domain-containing protein [Fusibacter ferrireducens]
MINRLRSILGIEIFETTDKEMMIHDRKAIFNFGVFYWIVRLFFYLFSSGLHLDVKNMPYNSVVFGGIFLFLIALKIFKKAFWMDAFLVFLMLTKALDFVLSPNSIQSMLVIVLTLFMLFYFVRDFVRLILPVGIFCSVLLVGILYNSANAHDVLFSTALVLILSVLAVFFGRDRYLNQHMNIKLTQKQETLMEELKSVNCNLNGELLKQSVHLMNIEEAEAKFRALTSAINAAIFLIDDEDNVTYSNHWLFNNHGVNYEHVQTINDFKKMFSEETYGRLKASYRATQKTSESTILREIPFVLPNGAQLWMNVKFTTVDTSGVLVTGFDVTERKKNEERIEKLSAVKDILIKLNPLMIQNMKMIDLFEYVLTHMMGHITHADLACILKLEGSKMKVLACKGYNQDKSETYQIELEQSFIYSVAKGDLTKPIIVNDIQEQFAGGFTNILENDMALPIQSSLCTPILVDGVLYGMINMDAFQNHVFSSEDMSIMGFLAEQLGYAIKTQRMLETRPQT